MCMMHHAVAAPAAMGVVWLHTWHVWYGAHQMLLHAKSTQAIIEKNLSIVHDAKLGFGVQCE